MFFDIKEIVHKEFVLAGQTVNFAYYCEVLQLLRENVQRLRSELWRKYNCLSQYDKISVSRFLFSPENFWPKTT
jgi:hypothetical protein